jgi:hypothetical protein
VNAIKEGAAAAPLVAELQAEEARKAVLVQELGELDHTASVASLEDKRLLREVMAQAVDLKRLLLDHVPKARQMLRKLDVHILCAPVEEHGKKGYRFTLTGTYMRILGSINVGRVPWPPPATSSSVSPCCALSSKWGGT